MRCGLISSDLIEAVRQVSEERRRRSRSDRRGGAAADDANGRCQIRRLAGARHAVPHPRTADRAAHAVGQRASRPSGRTRPSRALGRWGPSRFAAIMLTPGKSAGSRPESGPALPRPNRAPVGTHQDAGDADGEKGRRAPKSACTACPASDRHGKLPALPRARARASTPAAANRDWGRSRKWHSTTSA